MAADQQWEQVWFPVTVIVLLLRNIFQFFNIFFLVLAQFRRTLGKIFIEYSEAINESLNDSAVELGSSWPGSWRARPSNM